MYKTTKSVNFTKNSLSIFDQKDRGLVLNISFFTDCIFLNITIFHSVISELIFMVVKPRSPYTTHKLPYAENEWNYIDNKNKKQSRAKRWYHCNHR